MHSQVSYHWFVYLLDLFHRDDIGHDHVLELIGLVRFQVIENDLEVSLDIARHMNLGDICEYLFKLVVTNIDLHVAFNVRRLLYWLELLEICY